MTEMNKSTINSGITLSQRLPDYELTTYLPTYFDLVRSYGESAHLLGGQDTNNKQ